MQYTNNKDLNKLIHELVLQGWVFKRGRRHNRLMPPGHTYPFVLLPSTPSCGRVLKIFNNKVKKVSLDVQLPTSKSSE